MLLNSYFPEEARKALINVKLLKEDLLVESLIGRVLVMRFDLLLPGNTNSAYKVDLPLDTCIDAGGNLYERTEKHALESIVMTSRIVSIECDSYIKENRVTRFRPDRDVIDYFSLKIYLDVDFIASMQLRFLTIVADGLCLAYDKLDQDDEDFDDSDIVRKLNLMQILEYQVL